MATAPSAHFLQLTLPRATTGATGAAVGAAVGLAVGLAVGVAVGAAVGLAVGAAVGLAVGAAVGAAVGLFVGAAVGLFVGAAVTGAEGSTSTAGGVTRGGVNVEVLHTPQLGRPSQDSRRAAWHNPQQPYKRKRCKSGQCGNGERYLVVVVGGGKRLP